MPCSAPGEYLRAGESGIEHAVDTRDVVSNDGFQPTLGLRAIQRVAGVGGQGGAVELQILQQAVKSGAGGRSEFLARFI